MYKEFTKEMMIHCLQQGDRIETILHTRLHDRQPFTNDAEQIFLREYIKALQRFRLCMQALTVQEWQALHETYGKNEKVSAAAFRLGISRNTLGKYRKQGLEHLQRLYRSEYTAAELQELGIQALFGNIEREDVQNGD